MKLNPALTGAALLALTACGGDFFNSDAGTYQFSTGNYAVTNAVLAPSYATDQCGLLPAYQAAGKTIGVIVSGTTITFNLANDPQAPSETLPLAVLDGNTIDTPTEANYTVAYGTGCVVRIHRYVTGSVVNNNAAALSLTFSVAVESGSCPANITSFAAVPCATAYQFTATRFLPDAG